MPRKSAINRGAAKFNKLYMRILNTVKAQFPNAPDEVVAQHAAEGVYKYASALGYYEGMWRGFKAYLEGKGTTNVVPQHNGAAQICRGSPCQATAHRR